MTNTNAPTVRKKMYKAGKVWLTAAATGLVIGLAGTTTITADTSASHTVIAQESASSSSSQPSSSTSSTSSASNASPSNTSGTTATSAPSSETSATESSSQHASSSSMPSQTPNHDDQLSKTAPVTSPKTPDNQKTPEPSTPQNNVAPAPSQKAANDGHDDSNVVPLKPLPTQPDIQKPQTESTTHSSELTPLGQKLLDDAKIDADTKKQLNQNQIKALNAAAEKYYANPDKTAPAGQITYHDFDSLVDQLNSHDPRVAVPYFNADQIKNLPAARTRSVKTQKIENLDVWDSWVVQDAKSQQVANIAGHQVMLALAGSTTDGSDTHMYMLSAPYKATSLADWKMVGPVFGEHLTTLDEDWSGSATVNSDNSIQLFFTRYEWKENLKIHTQKLYTANISVSQDTNSDLKIDGVRNDHLIFSGDGKYYQTVEDTLNKPGENFTLRDPHVIEIANKRYIVFEGNTGSNQPTTFTDLSYYGGNLHYNVMSLINVAGNEHAAEVATLANGAIGLASLSTDQNNPDIVKLYSPLVTSNMITDEIERANVVPLNNKYYLFTNTRTFKSTLQDTKKRTSVADIALLGYVSDTLFGPYTPLNSDGVVATDTRDPYDRTATYSYYCVPIAGYSDRLLVTSYISNRGEKAGPNLNASTAPSFIIKINPDGTTAVQDTITTQNDWVDPYNAIDPAMYGFPGQKIDQKLYINSLASQYDILKNAPGDKPLSDKDGKQFIPTRIGDTGPFNGLEVQATHQYVTADQRTWYEVTLNDQSVWIDSQAVTTVPVQTRNTTSFVNFSNRPDVMYANMPAGFKDSRAVGNVTDYQGQRVTIRAQYDTNGATWNLVTINNQNVWIDSRSFASDFYRSAANNVFINSTNRSDGLWENAPYGQKNANYAGDTRRYNNAVVPVSKQFYAASGTVWDLITLNGQHVWVDQQATTALHEQAVNEHAYVNAKHGADGLYANMPYGSDGAKWITDITHLDGKFVTVSAHARDAYGIDWRRITHDGQQLWVDSRALTATFSRDLKATRYVDSIERTDGLWQNAPYGEQGATWVGTTAELLGRQVAVTKEFNTNAGVRWHQITLDGQTFWVDSQALSATDLMSQMQAVHITTDNRKDSLWAKAPYGYPGATYVQGTEKLNGQPVIFLKSNDFNQNWALIQYGNQRVWIDKQALVADAPTQKMVISAAQRTDSLWANQPWGTRGATFAGTTASHDGQLVTKFREQTDANGVTWALVNWRNQFVWLDQRALTSADALPASATVSSNAQRNDSLWANAPYGSQGASYAGNAKAVNGQHVNVLQQTRDAQGNTWYLVAANGRNVWIDKHALTQPSALPATATITSNTQHSDSLWANAPYGTRGATYAGNAKALNGQRVTVLREQTDAHNVTWYLVQRNGQQFWLDKNALK